MTPQQAVLAICAIFKAVPAASDDQIHTLLVKGGVPVDLAKRTYDFAQIAWGRVALDGLKITFRDEYACFNAHGDVVESGQLSKEPSYVAAAALAKGHGL
jgi:hypothetical protein